MNTRNPFESFAHDSRRISTSAKARFNSSRINTSKKFSIFCISFIQLDFKPTRINTSGNKDLKSFRINTSKKQGRGLCITQKRLIPRNQPPLHRPESAAAYVCNSRNLLVHVDADIEGAVVPIGFVIAAPLAVAIHFGDVVLHLRTIVSVARGVVIDFGFIGVEAVAAIAGIVVIGAGWSAEREDQACAHSGGQSDSSEKFRGLHKNLLSREERGKLPTGI
jgi:hypothetical protein